MKAVVLPAPGVTADETLRDALMVFAREVLPSFKCPRTIDFADDLPRLDSGKIQRRLVREPYWAGRKQQI